MDPTEKERLVREAIAARERSYSPYSKFAVGAAALFADREIVTGCNVENASYGLTTCAERVALFRAVAEGKKGLIAIAVASGPGASMCGACRQVVREFAVDPLVLLADAKGVVRETTLAKLLPDSFGPESLL